MGLYIPIHVLAPQVIRTSGRHTVRGAAAHELELGPGPGWAVPCVASAGNAACDTDLRTGRIAFHRMRAPILDSVAATS